MKLLSICIPTYNRNTELSKLYNEFVKKIIEYDENKIEIIICDNSDSDIAKLNQTIFSNEVKYIKNKQNLGFSGNVLKCYEIASAEYIWILPDNDDIFLENFFEMYDYLKSKKNNIDGVLIPFQSQDILDEIHISKLPEVSSISNLYNQNIIPFILLSSAIVKRDMKYFNLIKKELSSNDFVQIALFSMALKDSNKIYNFSKPVIDYAVEYNGRFNPFKTYDSMHKVMNFLSKYFNIDINKIDLREFRSLIASTFLDDTGLYKVYEIDKVRQRVNEEAKKYNDLKISLYMLLFKLPKLMRKHIYLLFYTYKRVDLTFNVYKYFYVYNKLFFKSYIIDES